MLVGMERLVVPGYISSGGRARKDGHVPMRKASAPVISTAGSWSGMAAATTTSSSRTTAGTSPGTQGTTQLIYTKR